MSETVAETTREKALRLLQEGRLMVERVEPETGFVLAHCRGDSGQLYDLGHDPRNDQWRCNCREMKGNCSHLQALKLVVVV